MNIMVIDVSDQNFENEVIKSELPVLLDLWAPWCGPCHMVAPVIDGLAGKYNGKIKFSVAKSSGVSYQHIHLGHFLCRTI